MTTSFFYTIPPQYPAIGFEYDKSKGTEEIAYASTPTEYTLATIPTTKLEKVKNLVAIGPSISHPTWFEYDTDDLVDNKLGVPGIFKSIAALHDEDAIMTAMFDLIELPQSSLPELVPGIRYTHVGGFLNRKSNGIRLHVGGNNHSVREFIVKHGGNPHWFDVYEHYHATAIASFDLINASVENLRIEFHSSFKSTEIPELVNDEWAQDCWNSFEFNIHDAYAAHPPKSTLLSHFKVGANDAEIESGYTKLYLAAAWV